MTAPDNPSRADFFTREWNRLVGYVRSLIADAADRDGEDIVQDVAASLFDSTDITAPIENFSAYVYQALRNRVVDRFRRKRDQESLDAPLPGETGLILSDILTDLKFDSAGELERGEIGRNIEFAIDSLDEKSREIFLLTEVEGRSFQELSDAWEVPIGTLLARKSRAMKKLREILCDIDPDHYLPLL